MVQAAYDGMMLNQCLPNLSSPPAPNAWPLPSLFIIQLLLQGEKMDSKHCLTSERTFAILVRNRMEEEKNKKKKRICHKLNLSGKYRKIRMPWSHSLANWPFSSDELAAKWIILLPKKGVVFSQNSSLDAQSQLHLQHVGKNVAMFLCQLTSANWWITVTTSTYLLLHLQKDTLPGLFLFWQCAFYSSFNVFHFAIIQTKIHLQLLWYSWRQLQADWDWAQSTKGFSICRFTKNVLLCF